VIKLICQFLKASHMRNRWVNAGIL